MLERGGEKCGDCQFDTPFTNLHTYSAQNHVFRSIDTPLA